jgi:hypothetical protein
MMLTGRTIALLVTMALATGGAVWGLHAQMTAKGDPGSDYGLDTNGNGTFDWLVVEAHLSLPQSGTWDLSAALSSTSAPPNAYCGYGAPPVPILAGGTLAPIRSTYSIAYVYERYFFTAGTQTVRMAFSGTDIARSGIDGPYSVAARLSLGGLPYMQARPLPDPSYTLVEWNYTTKAYSASAFEQPFRPAAFSGGHSDSAVDVDADGLADYLELRADVVVNRAGHYTLSGYLSKGSGTDVIRFIAAAYSDFDLATSDTSVVLRFRGDQIRQANVDGPWDFSLTLFGGMPYLRGNVTPGGAPVVMPPQPAYYPETLCGTTSAYRATAFDNASELVRYTGRFQELTPDWNRDGTFDTLIVRAEVKVFISTGVDLSGVLRPIAGPAELARAAGQTWLREGFEWVDFSFPGPAIRRSGVDGPYSATLSITPGTARIDPATTYTTRAYKATDFDARYSNGTRGYWIGDLGAVPSASSLTISISVVRGNDRLTVVLQDALTLTVADVSGTVVGTFKDAVYLAAAGAVQSFTHTLDSLSRGSYTIRAVLGDPSQPVDVRTIVVTL